MSVSVLSNLGALSAMSAVAPITGGLTGDLTGTGTANELGLFSLLFSQQMGTNAASNPLLASLIAENPSAAPQLIKNALHLSTDSDDDSNTLDLTSLFAMIQPNAEDVLAQVTPNVENRNDLALSTLNNLIGNYSGGSNNSSNALLNALMAQVNAKVSAANNAIPESAKLAAEGDIADTPFNQILNSIETAKTAQTATTQSVAAPVGSQNWSTEFNQQIVWAAKNEVQSAEIRLHPENLGPIKINLNIADGKAQIAFVSAHSEVRQSIQDALPQLKEMLAASGIDLGQTNVGSEEKSPNFQEFAAHSQNQSGILSGEPTFEETAQDLLDHVIAQTPIKVLKADSSAVDLFA